jgi:hypothetical protein
VRELNLGDNERINEINKDGVKVEKGKTLKTEKVLKKNV